jgi:2-polyprenyl-6-methoxyphenol hydroxylase-like FAD-dependent oxidoreductase
MSGLLHAIVLQRLGHNVYVLEKSPVSILQSEAAGLSAGPQVQKLIDEYVRPSRPYAMTADSIKVVNVQGEVINLIAAPLHLTTWRVLHSMLRSHLIDQGAMYETDKLAQEVKYDGEKVVVTYSDTTTRISNFLEADLVIAADGGHSKIRGELPPGLSPKYVGYVTWRGAVPESAVSAVSREVLQNRVINLRTDQGYIIS